MHSTRHSPPYPQRDANVPVGVDTTDAARLNYEQARDVYRTGDYETALHHLYPLLKERPLDVSVNKLLGYAHFARGDYALALAPLSAASMFAPHDPEPMLINANCLAKLGEGALARDLAMHALETARDDAAYADIGANAERLLATL